MENHTLLNKTDFSLLPQLICQHPAGYVLKSLYVPVLWRLKMNFFIVPPKTLRFIHFFLLLLLCNPCPKTLKIMKFFNQY